jgi:peptidase E
MSLPLKPIYLLADSQLLFLKEEGSCLLDSVRGQIEREYPKAAYIGAANGDNPAYYSIFEAAMESVHIDECRMIPSSLSTEDTLFIDDADLILLAGGDVLRGWKVLEENGLKEQIVRRYYEGATLIGVSAGAVQLGLFGWPEDGLSPDNLTSLFKLVPFIISAHDEKGEWEELKSTIQLMGGRFKGIGIPLGGGAIYHPQQFLEPVRFALNEFSLKDGQIVAGLLCPSQQLETYPSIDEDPASQTSH